MTVRTVDDEQLGRLARKQGDLFRRVREGTLPPAAVLGGLQDLIEGNFGTVPKGPRRLIAADAVLFIPDGHEIYPEDQLPNVVRGEIEFDPAQIAFHLDASQKGNPPPYGSQMRDLLKGKKVYDARVLDHLLANTNLIPEAWKVDEQGLPREIYFWGTISRVHGDLCVRYLSFYNGMWCWSLKNFIRKWTVDMPAAVAAD